MLLHNIQEYDNNFQQHVSSLPDGTGGHTTIKKQVIIV